jgi:hypothetical protein
MRYFNQRNFEKIDWSISLSMLFAIVLTFIAACVDSSGPIGAPDVIPMATVSSVKVSLAQPTLALGQSTQATVVATSSDGQSISGPVNFSSQNPSVATVSSKGVVSALTAGIAVIQAAIGSHAASATLTVKPLASPTAVVAVVSVTLDSTSLTIGHSAKASAIVMDSAGNLISDQTVTWTSLSPTIATVSSIGTVTAMAAGSVTIQASASAKAASASLTVFQVDTSTVIASHDFEDGKSGPFKDFGTPSIDYPQDPTGSGRGKVCRILYAPPNIGATSSNDENMQLDTQHHYRYGETIWFKGDVYLPSAIVSGGPRNPNDFRKLVDYFTVNKARLVLTRQQNGNLHWMAGDAMDGGVYHEDVHIGDTGIPLLDDKWYTIEVMMRTNSADGVRDGRLEFYVNNPTSTPDAVVSSGLGWITEYYGGTYFSSFRFGTQLTTWTDIEPTYAEYRYWDNVTFSKTRVGH